MSGPLEIKVGLWTLSGAPGRMVSLYSGDPNAPHALIYPEDVPGLAEALLAFTVEESMPKKQPQAVECRSCRALIFFAVTPVGKRMPIDVKPDPAGKLIGWLAFDGGRAELHVDHYRADEPKHQGRNRWTSHFATCEFRDEHRRGP